MTIRICTAAVSVALAAATPVSAAPTTVDLRVEGGASTIYEASVTTDGKTIEKDASGPHRCDGTNGRANTSAGPTMTTALDDGSLASGFTWAGTWYDSFEDFSIDRIGPDSNDNATGRYWGYALNYTVVEAGGCQQRVAAGDQVLFAYDLFGKPLLRLAGPPRAATGETVTVTVTDGRDGSRVAGASVGGRTTGPDGTASFTFDSPGVRRLKADRAESVRSNAIEICVYEPGSGGCETERPASSGAPGAGPGTAAGGTADTRRPTVRIASVRRAIYRRGPRLLRGRVLEDRGIHQVYLRLRRLSPAGCRWFSAAREGVPRRGRCRRARFFRVGHRPCWSYLLPAPLPSGRYLLEVKALDRSFNAGRASVRFEVR